MIKIGQLAELPVIKILNFGAYLDAGETEILLPIKEVPLTTNVGDKLQVFIYKDSANRPIASTKKPLIILDHFSCLEVKDTNKYGAFLDWGMDNQLLVPFREQHAPLERGKSYVVKMYVDTKSDRLVATSRIIKHLISEAGPELKNDEPVDLLVYGQMDTAYKVIINQKYSGLLYKSDVFRPISYGETLTGYVKKIRDDLKIDITLRIPGPDEYTQAKKLVLEKLAANAGFLALNDDSAPEKVKNILQMSKKTFKKVIGSLYKERKITIGEDGIRLATDDKT